MSEEEIIKLLNKINYFDYVFRGEKIRFYITRVYEKAIRVSINHTKQAIWIPKKYINFEPGSITVSDITWKLRGSEFQHKLNLAKK